MTARRHLALTLLGLVLLCSGPTPSPGIDLNGDGMSDVWQAQYGVTALDRDFDWDLDGSTNYVESLFRTNPHLNGAPNPNLDMFGISHLTVSAGMPTLHWPTENGACYQVQTSTDMDLWSNVGAPIEGDGTMEHFNLPGPGTFGFYRVLPSDPGDADGDRLDLWEERFLGSDPNNADDNNGNGAPDDWEAWLFGSPSPVTATSDHDLDGVFDVDEFTLELNPHDLDSDNDGRSDGAEVSGGTDPAVHDGLQDPVGPTGLEVFAPLPHPVT